MKKLFILLVLIGCGKEPDQNLVEQFPVSTQTQNKEIRGNLENSSEAQKQAYVVLISLDGYRYDYTEKYGASHLAAFETYAQSMIPSFPSKTFPNHYSLVTGQHVDEHGLLGNIYKFITYIYIFVQIVF